MLFSQLTVRTFCLSPRHFTEVSMHEVIWIIDFVATLPTEVEVIWSSRLTACSFVFLLNRYAYLVHIFFQAMTTLTTGASLSDR